MSFRVVLIDDSETDIAIASSAIQAVAPNAKLQVIRDGESALSYFTSVEPAGQPTVRLVLLDLGLPRGDGLDVLRELRSFGVRPSMPIVIVTIKQDPELMKEANALGISGYVVKAGDPAQLRQQLDTVLRYWLKATADPMPDGGVPPSQRQA